MPAPSGYTTAQKLFLIDLAKNLFPNNEFLAQSKDWSKYAVGNEVIWQQSGAIPNTVINNATVPLTAIRRNDIKRAFSIDEYQSIPTRLDWSEELLVSYDKRADVLENHQKQIEVDLVMRTLYNWALNAGVIRTTGATRPASAAGATGLRNSVTYKDLIALRKLIVKQEVKLEAGKMNILLPVDLEEDIMNLIEFKSRDFYPTGNGGSNGANGGSTVMNGLLGTIAGCNVWTRSSSLVTNAAGGVQNPKADDTVASRAGAISDNQGIIMWHSDYVIRAKSKATKVNIVEQHGGLEISITAVAGGSNMYATPRGIAVLAEV